MEVMSTINAVQPPRGKRETTYQTFKLELDAGAATVTIANSPLSVLDGALLVDLDALATELKDDRSVKVLVFQSADPEFFIPHGDMTFVNASPEDLDLPLALDPLLELNVMQRFFQRIR